MSLMQDALRAMFVRAASDLNAGTLNEGWPARPDELRAAAALDTSWLLMAHACDGWPSRDPISHMTVWEPLTWIERERAITLMIDHQAAHPDNYSKDDDQ